MFINPAMFNCLNILEHLSDDPVTIKELQDKTGLTYWTIRYLIYKKLRPSGLVLTYPQKGWAIKRHPCYPKFTVYDVAVACGYKVWMPGDNKGSKTEEKIKALLKQERIYE